MFLTASVLLAELVVSCSTNSITLMADSFNMLHNAFVLVISYVSIIRPDFKTCNRSTFGWARVKLLGIVMNSVFICSLYFHVTIKSVKRILVPEDISHPLWILSLGSTSLCINGLRLLFLNESLFPNDRELLAEAGDNVGDKSLDAAGVFVNNICEVSSSSVVIVSSLAFMLSGWEHRHCFDPLLSLVVVVTTLVFLWPRLREAGMVLILCLPPNIELEELKGALLSSDKAVQSIDELQVWCLAGERCLCCCHMTLQSLPEGEKGEGEGRLHQRVMARAKEVLNTRGIAETTIQIHCKCTGNCKE